MRCANVSYWLMNQLRPPTHLQGHVSVIFSTTDALESLQELFRSSHCTDNQSDTHDVSAWQHTLAAAPCQDMSCLCMNHHIAKKRTVREPWEQSHGDS